MVESPELKENLKRLETRLYVTYALGLFALVVLSIVSNYVLKERAATQATSLIKRMVQRGDYRETIYTLNDAQLDYFDAVVYFNQDSNRLFSLPAQLDPAFVNDKNLWSQLLYSRLTIDLFFDQEHRHRIGSVLFIFGRFSHVPYALMIWLFFVGGTVPLLRSSRLRVIENFKRHAQLSEEATRADLARRVRHDIRSPLGALLIGIRSLSGVKEENRELIQKATERIKEIVSELELIRVLPPEAKQDSPPEQPTPQSVLTLVQDIIQEKRAQLIYKGIRIMPEFSGESFFQFAKISASEFKRALSNIIDNAVESFSGVGQIKVRVGNEPGQIRVEVEDTGRGIAEAALPHVGSKGFSTKPYGTGLGLFYAKMTAEAAGGSIGIKSKVGVGTNVTVTIPACKPPNWYVPSVNIPSGGTVVILDDQESTHLSWRARLDELKIKGATFTVVFHRTPRELIAWHSANHSKGKAVIYLLDYDLGENQKTGLDVARELGIQASTVLVTGHFDSDEIQRACAEQKIGLLPKPYLSMIDVHAV